MMDVDKLQVKIYIMNMMLISTKKQLCMTETSSPFENAKAKKIKKSIKVEVCLNNIILKEKFLIK